MEGHWINVDRRHGEGESQWKTGKSACYKVKADEIRNCASPLSLQSGTVKASKNSKQLDWNTRQTVNVCFLGI